MQCRGQRAHVHPRRSDQHTRMYGVRPQVCEAHDARGTPDGLPYTLTRERPRRERWDRCRTHAALLRNRTTGPSNGRSVCRRRGDVRDPALGLTSLARLMVRIPKVFGTVDQPTQMVITCPLDCVGRDRIAIRGLAPVCERPNRHQQRHHDHACDTEQGSAPTSRRNRCRAIDCHRVDDRAAVKRNNVGHHRSGGNEVHHGEDKYVRLEFDGETRLRSEK